MRVSASKDRVSPHYGQSNWRTHGLPAAKDHTKAPAPQPLEKKTKRRVIRQAIIINYIPTSDLPEDDAEACIDTQRIGSLAPRAPNAGAESTRDRIANLQRALRRLGYDPGPVDGIPGARTRGAIRAFQADARLPVNGQISKRLESAIPAAVVTAEQAHAPAPEPTHRPLELQWTGSGSRVRAQGHVLTNTHRDAWMH